MSRWVLGNKYDFYESSYGKKVRCGHRISRTRILCKVKFGIGDGSYFGRVVVWNRWRKGDVWQYTAGKIKLFDEYCYYVQNGTKSQCTKVDKRWG